MRDLLRGFCHAFGLASVAVLLSLGIPHSSSTLAAQADGLNEAIPAVVRILGCDARGCDRGLGSGVIIHPAGVILTANHVTLTDPQNPASDRLTDFVIELSEDVRLAPVARYRAELIAFDVADDLALLRIYRDEVSNLPVVNLDDLPSIVLADLDRVSLGERLQILGYPLEGGESINYAEASHGGYQEAGALIKIQSQLSPGNSGGPALVEQAGELRIAGIVIERRGAISFLRSIDRLHGLTWLPAAERAWATDVGLYYDEENDLLTLELDLHALDLGDRSVSVLAYAYTGGRRKLIARADSQHRTISGQSVLTGHVEQNQVVEQIEQWQLNVSVEELAIAPEDTLFRVLIWDPSAQRVLWHDPAWYRPELVSSEVAVAPAPTATEMPKSTPTAGITPTSTPDVTATSTSSSTPPPTETPDLAATETAVAESIFATLTAQAPTATNTPRPPTATSTATSLPTATNTLEPPTPTPTLVATTWPPSGSIIVGKVLWNGAPVAGSRVALKEWGSYYNTKVIMKSEVRADGTFVIENPPVGQYHIFAIAPDSPDWHGWTGREINIVANSVIDENTSFRLAKRMQIFSPSEGENVNSTTPDLQFEAVPDAVEYQVVIWNIDSSPSEDIFRKRVTTTTLTLPSLEANTNYQIAVDAYSADGTTLAYDHVNFSVR